MNILLVDDEAITIELLMSTIAWDSFSFDYIYTASSAAKAKQLLSENKIEILLCDIEMPMASGFALFGVDSAGKFSGGVHLFDLPRGLFPMPRRL